MKSERVIDKNLIHFFDHSSGTGRIMPDPELFFLLEGSLDLSIDDQQYPMRPDDIIIVNAGRKCSCRISPDSLLCIVRIPQSVIEDTSVAANTLIWCNSVVDENDNFLSLRITVKRLLNQYVQLGNSSRSPGFLSSFYALLEILQLHFTLTQRNTDQQEDKYAERMEQICRYINANYSEPLSLKELSEHLYLSVSYLSRFFKKKKGMNFEDYLRNIRISHALDDLLYTDHTLTRIAVDNGFSTAAHLNRAFRAVYGTSPAEYRKSLYRDAPEEDHSHGEHIQSRLENYLRQGTVEEAPGIHILAEIDADESVTYQKNWNQMINIGSASDLLDADMQEHVLLLHSQLHFQYVRIWNLFSEKLLVRVKTGGGTYYFRKIDHVLDFLVEHGIIPFLDLGKMPKLILGSLKVSVYQTGTSHSDYEYFDMDQWETLLEEFIKHIIQRYGRDEVQKWKYELWDRSQGNEQTEEMIIFYLKLFSRTHQIFRRMLPEAMLGGCGSTTVFNRKMFYRLLDLWKKHAPLPDFFSIKAYAYIREEDENDIFASRSTDPLFLVHMLREVRRIMEEHSFRVSELYATEWNQSLSSRNYMNDSCYRGAFNLQSLLTCIGEADLLSYFNGTDRVSEFVDTSGMLHGGLGIMTKDGIMKPAGCAFIFANELYQRCLGRTNNYMVTTDGHNNYTIVCHNARNLNYHYYLTDEMCISREKIWLYFEDMERIQYDFRIRNAAEGTYQVQIFQVNESAGSILDLWKDNDFFESTSKKPVQYFRNAVHPKVSFRSIANEQGCLSFSLEMQPNEIALIKIEGSI